MKLIGKRAIGIIKDTKYRTSYKGEFPNGWKTEGTIIKYDKEKEKYLIEGASYIFNKTGEFRLNNVTGDWFFRHQITLLDEENEE